MKTRTVIAFQSPLGAPVEIIKHTFSPHGGKPVKRISFVAGLHGDELEGVALCHRLIRHLQSLKETEPEAFRGEIHIYPAANPLALATSTRLWPFFSVDMNRQMGDGTDGSLPSQTATALLEDLKSGSDLVVDFHASNLHLLELPQIRILEEFRRKLVPLATLCNMDLIWVHPSSGVFEATLGYNLNRVKIPTLVVETGICLRVHRDFQEQIFQGMLHLLRHTRILVPSGPAPRVKPPRLLQPSQVALAQARQAGLFLAEVKAGDTVPRGARLGELIDPVGGQVLEAVQAPCAGLVFTLRLHPLTYPGAPLARLAKEESDPP